MTCNQATRWSLLSSADNRRALIEMFVALCKSWTKIAERLEKDELARAAQGTAAADASFALRDKTVATLEDIIRLYGLCHDYTVCTHAPPSRCC